MENMNNVKTPKEYKIKKIEELKEAIPSYLSTFAWKITCATSLLLVTSGIQTPIIVAFANLAIASFACFYIETTRKNNNLKEIDRLQTDLLLDRVTESEFKKILEEEFSRISDKKSKVMKAVNIKFLISLICTFAAIFVKITDDKIRGLNTILFCFSTFETLSGIEGIFENDYLTDRTNQIKEKQEMFELTRKRK